MEPRFTLIRFLQDRSGSSFVELALLFPIILIMCFGTMDFARIVYAGTEVAGATVVESEACIAGITAKKAT